MTQRDKFWVIFNLTWILLMVGGFFCLACKHERIAFAMWVLGAFLIFDMRPVQRLALRFRDE